MENAMQAPLCRHRYVAALLGAASGLFLANQACACDGKNYSFEITVGKIVSAGGLAVQLDKIKLLDDVPDKYTISIKDDDTVLADHVLLMQYDTLNYKTRCGTVTIGADRQSMFHHGVLTMNWSYF